MQVHVIHLLLYLYAISLTLYRFSLDNKSSRRPEKRDEIKEEENGCGVEGGDLQTAENDIIYTIFRGHDGSEEGPVGLISASFVPPHARPSSAPSV